MSEPVDINKTLKWLNLFVEQSEKLTNNRTQAAFIPSHSNKADAEFIIASGILVPGLAKTVKIIIDEWNNFAKKTKGPVLEDDRWEGGYEHGERQTLQRMLIKQANVCIPIMKKLNWAPK